MEEVHRMGECGDAIAIMREWEMKDEAVKWLTETRGYIEVRDKSWGGEIRSGINDDDQNGEFVLLMQVQRDIESVREACKAGKEEVVVARSLVEGEQGSNPGTVCELLASFSYLECPRRAKSDDDNDDDLRYYYRAVGCTLSLPAYSAHYVNAKTVEEVNLSDSIDQESCEDEVEGEDDGETVEEVNLSDSIDLEYCDDEVEGEDDGETVEECFLSAHSVCKPCAKEEVVWKPCASFVLDTSKLGVQGPNLSLPNVAGSQTPLVRFVVNGFASADEFHLDLKLEVESLFVGVSKVEFLDTDTCLGFYPDWIRLCMEPGWQDMSVAIFDQSAHTDSMPSKSTQNTEIAVGIGLGPGNVSAKRAWGKEMTAVEDDHEPVHVEYETGGGGVASIEWRICRWKDGKRYNSNRPLSSSFISKKLPKLPFNGTAPCLQNLSPVRWRLPLNARRQELSIKLRLLFDMQLISLTSTTPFLKSPKHLKVPLQKEFPFTIQLPTSLV